jgi:hypothetical protein
MKAGGSFCLLLLALSSGCVNLDKPKEVAACAKSGLCSDDPQTGGASGGETAATGGAGGNSEVVTGGGTAGTGGTSATGGITGSGGLVASGGTTARDGSAGAGGVGSGGASPVGGAIGTGGALGSGGNSSGGTSGGASTGGVVSSGGVTGSGGDSSAGGASASGGATAAGGTVGTGGVTGSGGKAGTGGAVTTGGTLAAGGSTTAGCGTTKSTVSQTFNFAAGAGTLVLGPGSVSGSQVNYVTAGPKAKPALCSATSGCGALSVPFVSGAAAYKPFGLAVENFAPAISLVGATVTFSLAVDNPGTTQVPIQIQAYAQGDATSSYAWTNPVTVGGASLDAYAAATGFKDLTLSVTDYVSPTAGTKYCASVTAAIGIQVMNTAAITSSNAGTVTVYISKITITPPP